MPRTIDAIYEGGVLRPLQFLDGIAEHAHVKLTVESMEPEKNDLTDCAGTCPGEAPPRESPFGLWADLGADITEDDITEVRTEMWGEFPRENLP